jgi:hypothetical protein
MNGVLKLGLMTSGTLIGLWIIAFIVTEILVKLEEWSSKKNG